MTPQRRPTHARGITSASCAHTHTHARSSLCMRARPRHGGECASAECGRVRELLAQEIAHSHVVRTRRLLYMTRFWPSYGLRGTPTSNVEVPRGHGGRVSLRGVDAP